MSDFPALSILVAPQSNPDACPTCANPADTLIGRRNYCRSCARTMRLFVAMTPRKWSADELHAHVMDGAEWLRP